MLQSTAAEGGAETAGAAVFLESEGRDGAGSGEGGAPASDLGSLVRLQAKKSIAARGCRKSIQRRRGSGFIKR